MSTDLGDAPLWVPDGENNHRLIKTEAEMHLVRPKSLATFLNVDTGELSRPLSGLIAEGYVERVVDPLCYSRADGDQKLTVIRITVQGRAWLGAWKAGCAL